MSLKDIMARRLFIESTIKKIKKERERRQRKANKEKSLFQCIADFFKGIFK